LRALFEGRDHNPAHEEFCNSHLFFWFKEKKKNQCWDRMSDDDYFHVWDDEHCSVLYILLIKYSHHSFIYT
jgi:hypothetical protein